MEQVWGTHAKKDSLNNFREFSGALIDPHGEPPLLHVPRHQISLD